jgi:hypothetical protein
MNFFLKGKGSHRKPVKSEESHSNESPKATKGQYCTFIPNPNAMLISPRTKSQEKPNPKIIIPLLLSTRQQN